VAKLTDRVGIWPRLSGARLGEKPVLRRLAAILAADVAGYSRLMGADELGTHRLLMAHRSELIDPAVAAHRGRIVKTTGDGVLAEFASAVDAVACAIAIQRVLALRNDPLPENKRLQFRIGINVGDVIIEADDIFGDGVNVAARLEGLCEPGGLCIPAQSATRSATSCPWRSTISASRRLRTSQDQFARLVLLRMRSVPHRISVPVDRNDRLSVAAIGSRQSSLVSLLLQGLPLGGSSGSLYLPLHESSAPLARWLTPQLLSCRSTRWARTAVTIILPMD